MAEGPNFAPLDSEEAISIADEAKSREWDGFEMVRVAQTENETMVLFVRPRPWNPQKGGDEKDDNLPPKPQAIPPTNSTTRRKRRSATAGSATNCTNHPECLTSREHQSGPNCWCVYEGCPGGAIYVEPCA